MSIQSEKSKSWRDQRKILNVENVLFSKRQNQYSSKLLESDVIKRTSWKYIKQESNDDWMYVIIY